jgi:hypothetical protein
MVAFSGRIKERDLVVPALRAASLRPNGYISTTDLIKVLEQEFLPQGEDAAILANRYDSKFTQIVRNLKSHKNSRTSMFKKGFAIEQSEGLQITALGRSLLDQIDE